MSGERILVMQPRHPHLAPTDHGPAVVEVGRSNEGTVLVALTPPAAQMLASIISRGALTPPETEPETWARVVIDLLASAALCDTRPIEVVPVSGYIAPKGAHA